MEIEEGDLVLCSVDRIEGTTVFVNIQENHLEGCINLSEIAPGRIRNLRDYVVPKKIIVCKVLKITGKTIELSLRRVNQKEQKEIKDKYQQERNLRNILKSILKEKTEKSLKEITQKSSLSEFLEKAKEDSRELEKIVGKEISKKIIDILKYQKSKNISLKKEILMNTLSSDGINRIKEIFKEINKGEVKYISAGKYSIKVESEDPKKAESKLKEILEEIREKAKNKGIQIQF